MASSPSSTPSSPSTATISPQSSSTPPPISQFQSPSSTQTSISSPFPSKSQSTDDQPSQQSSLNPQRSQFSPSLIAVIVVIPVGFTALMLLYWRRRIWKRFTHLNPQSPSSAPSNSAVLPFPPGGTGADTPEGQRRADRLRRSRFGTRGRLSRSNSVRTVPEYSADPQDTEMTLAQTQQTGDPQPSFLMRLIGQHATLRPSTEDTTPSSSSQLPNPIILTNPPSTSPISSLQDEDPPPGYECQAGSSTQGGSESVHLINNNSSSSSSEPLPTPPQSHTIDLQLDRTYTSTSSLRSISSNRFPKPPANAFRALFHSRLNTPPLPPPTSSTHHQDLIPSTPSSSPDVYRLPSSGPTPDQIRFLESPANLSRLGVRPSSYASTDRPFSIILLSSSTPPPDPSSYSSSHPPTFSISTPPEPPSPSSPPPAFPN